ncbi:MAG: serine hydrolase [Anaerolineales bacterium]|nr:serine hydrolase [Anaerolineales bacterium]
MYVKLDEFRTGQTRRTFPLLFAFAGVMLLLSAMIFAAELVNYSNIYNNVNETFGDDVQIGGVQVGGQNEADRLALLESVYLDQPIVMYYDGSPIQLSPREVGFRLDTEAMQAAATTQIEQDFWGGYWRYLWGESQDSIDVGLVADFDPAELRAYVEELALRYDTQNTGISLDLAKYTFSGAEAQTRLDVDAAIPLIERALYQLDPEKRVIDLPLITLGGAEPTINDLRELITTYLELDGRLTSYNGPDQVASVFVIDLQTGEEVNINSDVVMDASSIIKIGILINYFRYAVRTPTADVKYNLANAVVCSSNGSANNIMEIIGADGSYIDGIRKVNDTVCQAGGANTQISSRLWIGPEGTGSIPIGYYTVIGVTPCPGNTNPGAEVNTQINTTPDNLNYTTAADAGTLLMQTYDCAVHGSGLRSIFPDEITQEECNWILNLLRGTHFIHMMELGVPEGTDFAHKVGYVGETFGDAGIVFSPGGDYVFVMYVWERGGVDGQGSLTDIRKWSMIGDVNRIVYNYFNPDQPMLQTRPPVSPLTGAACVMPLPGFEINLYDITENRFDEYGNPIPGVACYDSPECRPFDNWGQQ